MKKIVKGNDFTMKIPVSKYDQDLLVKYSLPGCTDIEVSLISGLGKRYQLEYNIGVDDDDVIYAHVKSNEIPLGSYSLEVKGKKYGISWRSNEYEQVCFVDTNKDGDTVFEPDEGEDSVEMDTAIVILARDVDLIYNSLDEIVNDLSGLKLDSSLSPTMYYQKDYINKLVATINSSISNVSNNLNYTSIRIKTVEDKFDDNLEKVEDVSKKTFDTSTRLNGVSVKLDEQKSELEDVSAKVKDCSTKISDISAKLDNQKSNLDSFAVRLDNDENKIENVSSRLKDNYVTNTQLQQKLDSSYADLSEKIKNTDVTKQLTPILNSISELNDKTSNTDSKLNNLIGTEVKNGTIDTFTDIKEFLIDISDSSTLKELLKNNSGNNTGISEDVLKNYYTKDVVDNISTRLNNTSTRLNDVSTNVKSINDNITSLNDKTSETESKLNDLIGTEVKNGTIDTFTDVKNFLANISDSSTLTELLKSKSDSTGDNTGISEDTLKNYYTKDVIDDLSTDISTKIHAIKTLQTVDEGTIARIKNEVDETSTRLNDSSNRLNTVSFLTDDVSSRLHDVSINLDNSSTKLYDVSVKLDDVIKKVNNGSGISGSGISVEQYLQDEKLIASTLNDLNNKIQDNQDSITRQLNTKYYKLSDKIMSETAKCLSLEQYSKDEKLIASTFNDLNNRVTSLEKEIEELKANKTN